MLESNIGRGSLTVVRDAQTCYVRPEQSKDCSGQKGRPLLLSAAYSPV
jgi:hypothetical protein